MVFLWFPMANHPIGVNHINQHKSYMVLVATSLYHVEPPMARLGFLMLRPRRGSKVTWVKLMGCDGCNFTAVYWLQLKMKHCIGKMMLLLNWLVVTGTWLDYFPIYWLQSSQLTNISSRWCPHSDVCWIIIPLTSSIYLPEVLVKLELCSPT